MERRSLYLPSSPGRISLKVTPGHFATNHSHVNYYIDMTEIKSNQRVAEESASLLAQQYASLTEVHAILCLDGTEVIGGFLAQQLSKTNYRSVNHGEAIYVLTPEFNAVGRMMLRDSFRPILNNQNILLLMASVTTGMTVQQGADCIHYYGGNLCGVSAIFSALDRVNDVQIHSLYHINDLPGYESQASAQCPACRRGEKLEAIINGFGYFRL